MYGSAGFVNLEPRLERLSFLSFFLRFRFGRLLLAFAAAGDGMSVRAAASTATPQVAAAATMTCARAESCLTMPTTGLSMPATAWLMKIDGISNYSGQEAV